MTSQPRRYFRSRVAPFPMPKHLPVEDAHRQVVDQLYEDLLGFNGIILGIPPGISALSRPELLRSAVERPFTTIGGSLAYPDGLLQAAALLYSLVQNHPFSDGNKRTAYWGSAYFLQRCRYWSGDAFINRTEAFAYEGLVLGIAREGEDVEHRRRAARYTIEEIAEQLDRIFAGSRKRHYTRRRERTGLFGWLSAFIRRDG